MPTKTKEINEKNNKKTNKVATTKTTVKPKTSSKGTAKKKDTAKKAVAKKAEKKVTAKKTTVKKTTTTAKKATVKRASTKKMTARKSTAKKATTTRKATGKTKKQEQFVDIVEYYDLPYRYNETVVKILYQTPNTLFVYWDISDKDRENYIKQYGENFFNITRPVLIIHNITMNYSFEVPIDDFANSWYLHINDSKCDYKVELGRRPNNYNEEATKEIQENINTDYIYVSSSNEIETPNDHVLFSTNENNTIKFRNIKNNDEKTISLVDFVRSLPALKEKRDIPIISEEIFQAVYSGIYKDEDINFFERLSNPSSGGLATSNMSSSRSALF